MALAYFLIITIYRVAIIYIALGILNKAADKPRDAKWVKRHTFFGREILFTMGKRNVFMVCGLVVALLTDSLSLVLTKVTLAIFARLEIFYLECVVLYLKTLLNLTE